MMKRRSINKQGIIAIVILVALAAAFIIPFTSSAKMVDVYEKSSETEHLNLNWYTVYDERTNGHFPDGKMLYQGQGTYSMQTDSNCVWYEYDSTHYAYTEAPFNAGNDSVLTIQTTFDTVSNFKQFGIMVRKSLDADSEHFYANFDPTLVRIDFRPEKTALSDYSRMRYSVDTTGKVHVKVVVTKNRGIAEFYVQYGDEIDEEGWNKLLTKQLDFIKKSSFLYAGIAIESEGKGHVVSAQCSNFSVTYQAPEGYELEDGTGGQEKPTEPEVQLPDDLVAAGDALLYETFTDNNMFPEDKNSITVSNPLWTVRTGEPQVVIDEAKKNRYLFSDLGDSPLFLETGNMEWTDYSVQVDLEFPENTLREEQNLVELLVRQRTAYAGGVGYYGVALCNEFSEGILVGQYLILEVKNGPTPSWTSRQNNRLCEKVLVAEGGMLELGSKHTLKVEVFDNTITVYLDNLSEPLIEYEDNRVGGYEANDPHLMGGIGFLIEKASIKIDNIVVRKMYDPLGGDYDNSVMGDYNQPIPEWLEEKYAE